MNGSETDFSKEAGGEGVSEVLNEASEPRLYALSDFSRKHSCFTLGTLRDIVFKAKPRESSQGTLPSNGFEKAIVRLGSRVFIDETEFFRCLKEVNPEWQYDP